MNKTLWCIGNRTDKMGTNNSSQSGGIGFCGLLTIVFIVLKLTHYIDWSWWWVLSPFWIPLAIVLSAILIVLVLQVYIRS